jgi:hypothetical protein
MMQKKLSEPRHIHLTKTRYIVPTKDASDRRQNPDSTIIYIRLNGVNLGSYKWTVFIKDKNIPTEVGEAVHPVSVMSNE